MGGKSKADLIEEIKLQQGRIESLEGEVKSLRANGNIPGNGGWDDRYLDFMDSLADWFWEMDANLRFSYVSPNVERLLGVPPESFYGKTRDEIAGQHHDKELLRSHREDLEAHRPFRDFLYQGLGDGDENRWFSVSGVPLHDRDGVFLGYRGTGREVTEQIRLQRETLEQEARFRKLIEDSLLGIYVHRDFTPLFVNTALVRTLGYASVAQFMTEVRSLKDVFHGDDLERLVGYNEQRNRGGDAPLQYEARFLRRDGSPAWLQMVVQLIRWDGAQAVLTTCIEITDRKEVEAASRDREQLLEAVFQTLPFAIAVKDGEGNYLEVNRQMADFYGKSVEEMLRINTLDLPLPDRAFKEFILEEDRKVIESRETIVHQEYDVMGPSGEREVRFMAKIPLMNEAGEVTRMMVASQNVTELVRAREELARSREAEMRAHQRLMDAVEALPVGFSLYDTEARLVVTNQAMLRLFPALTSVMKPGVTYEDLLRHAIDQELVHVPDGNRERWIADRLREFRSGNIKGERRLRDGTWYETYSHVTREGGSVHIRMDITRRKETEEALRRREEEYRTLYDETPIMLHSLDTRQRFTRINRYWVEEMGYEVSEVIGHHITEFLTPESRTHYLENVNPVFERDGRLDDIPCRMVKKNGEVIDVLLSSEAERDVDGNIVGSFANLKDITDLKRFEERLRSNEQLLQTVFDAIPINVYVKDTEGRHLMVNRAFAATNGKAPPDFQGLTVSELGLGTSEEREAIAEEDAHVIATGKATTFPEFAFTHPDGERRIRKGVKVPLRDAHGTMVGLVGVSEDITDQKEYERALIQNHVLMAKAQEVAHFGHMELDLESGVLTWSDEAFRIAGYEPQAFAPTAKDFADHLHPGDKKRVLQALDDTIRSERPFDLECRILRKDGSERTVQALGQILHGDDGQAQRMIGTVHDITDRVLTESALRQALVGMAKGQAVAHFGSIEWNPENDNHTWSDETFRILGLVPGAFKPDAARFSRALHPGDRKRVIQAAVAASKQGGAFHERYRIIRPDGEERVVEGRAEMAQDEAWDRPRLVGTMHDITEAVRLEEALRESEATLRLITDSLPVLISIVDSDLRYAFINRQYFEWFGAEPKDGIGKYVRDVVGEAAYAKVLPHMRKALAGEVVSFEDEIPYPNGSRWVHIQYVPQRGEDGSVGGFFALVSDISELKQVERALSDSEERFRSTIDNLPSAVIIKDSEGRYRYVNKKYEQWWGYSNAEVFGKTAEELFPPEEGAFFEAMDRLLMAEGKVQEQEMTFSLADGSRRVMRNTKFPVSDAEGDSIGIGVIITDLHELKEAEQALRESRERLQQATTLAGLGYWIWNAEKDRCQYSSAEHARIYGMSESEYMMHVSSGEGAASLVHPEDREAYLAVRRELRQGKGYDIEYRVVRGEGEIRHVREIARPVQDERGKVVRERGTVQDITDQKHQEAQLRQSQKMEAIGQLAGGVAHDFNNILQVVLGYTGLMVNDGELSEFHRSNVAEIHQAGERAAALTQQLLAFGRKQTLQFEHHNVNELIIRQARLVRRVIGETIELVYRAKANDPLIFADAGMIEQVLLNLIINARDAMPDGGTLTVSCENVLPDIVFRTAHPWAQAPAYVRIDVEDTGVGMPPLMVERIFEPFFTTKEVGKGSGLGLAMVYGIVQQHGGMIEVSSEEGKGSLFQVYLPLASLPPIDESRQVEETVPGGDETILVAEDEDDVLRLVSFLLQSAGYTVVQARDGSDALEIMNRRGKEIDLLLVDVVMPNLGGREFYERVRVQWPECKVIFTTGYASEAVDHAFLDAHGLRLIQKPYLPDELYRVLREVIDEV